jgi:hypothetical protein
MTEREAKALAKRLREAEEIPEGVRIVARRQRSGDYKVEVGAVVRQYKRWRIDNEMAVYDLLLWDE